MVYFSIIRWYSFLLLYTKTFFCLSFNPPFEFLFSSGYNFDFNGRMELAMMNQMPATWCFQFHYNHASECQFFCQGSVYIIALCNMCNRIFLMVIRFCTQFEFDFLHLPLPLKGVKKINCSL